MRRILTIAVLAMWVLPAYAQHPEYCNAQCGDVCHAYGWLSEPCVACNVTCSRRPVEREFEKTNECARWRTHDPERYRRYCE